MNILSKIKGSKKTKILILIKILGLAIIIFAIWIIFIIKDLHNKTRAFENTNALNVYAINLLTKPFSILADKYAIKNKKKIAVLYNYEKREIINNEKNNCYILIARRPNIFLQNKIQNEDFISLHMQLSAIINNNDSDIKLNSIAELINFIKQNKMILILNKNSKDIKEAIINWYEKYITDTVCASITQKIVPLAQYSINDISYKQIAISAKPIKNIKTKYVISSDNLYLISNINFNPNIMIDFLKEEIDIIFVNSQESESIKDSLKKYCTSHYLNNNFAKMLKNIELKNISDSPLSNNEIAIGLTSDIAQFGKVIYSSSENEDLVTWLMAAGKTRTECYSFFQFLKQNEAILNQYSVRL